MNRLNATLYQLLKARFGDIKVINEGESLIGNYTVNPISDTITLDVQSWGETYCICCPFCNESRNRLYINHRYGVFDENTNSANTNMVRCFNEECLKKDTTLYRDLYDKIFGLMNIDERRSIGYTCGKQPVTSVSELKEAPLPGRIISLGELPVWHKSIQYLQSRGYDVGELIDRHDLQYCQAAHGTYWPANERIIIPIKQNGLFVGWQARYVGDIDWKEKGIPKYYTLPSMPKRLILYNHDKAFEQDFVIITEGPTSCWAVWPYGVAILGKQATIQQKRIIVSKAAQNNKPIVILLDSDAKYEAERLYNSLLPHAKAGILKIVLPDDTDPGSYINNRHELWDIITKQAETANITLPLPS